MFAGICNIFGGGVIFDTSFVFDKWFRVTFLYGWFWFSAENITNRNCLNYIAATEAVTFCRIVYFVLNYNVGLGNIIIFNLYGAI